MKKTMHLNSCYYFCSELSSDAAPPLANCSGHTVTGMPRHGRGANHKNQLQIAAHLCQTLCRFKLLMVNTTAFTECWQIHWCR